MPSGSRVLLIGTTTTIQSGAYQAALQVKRAHVEEYILRTLAKEIEEGATEEKIYEIIKPCLLLAKVSSATHLLYGCTHYPLVHSIFKRCARDMGWKGVFIDPAVFVKEEVKQWGLEGDMETIFKSSKMTEVFRQKIAEFSA